MYVNVNILICVSACISQCQLQCFQWKREFYLTFLPEAFFFTFSIIQNHCCCLLSGVFGLLHPLLFIFIFYSRRSRNLNLNSVQGHQLTASNVKCKCDRQWPHSEIIFACSAVKSAYIYIYKRSYHPAGQSNTDQWRCEGVGGGEWLKRPTLHVGRATPKQKVVTFFSGTKYFLTVILIRTTCLKRRSQYAGLCILDVNPRAKVVQCKHICACKAYFSLHDICFVIFKLKREYLCI